MRVPSPSCSPRWSALALACVLLAHLGALVLPMSFGSPRAVARQPAHNTVLVQVVQAEAKPAVPIGPIPMTPLNPSKPLNPMKPKERTEQVNRTKPAPARAPHAPGAPPHQQEPDAPHATPEPAPGDATVAAALPPAQRPSHPSVPAAPEPLAPQFHADYLHNPPPAYPPRSRQAGEEGEVILKVYVEPSGLARSVEIQKGSGYVRLDRSAVRAVSLWRFIPARHSTEAVGAWVLVPIVFNLNG